jgi:hypothetical protein
MLFLNKKKKKKKESIYHFLRVLGNMFTEFYPFNEQNIFT